MRTRILTVALILAVLAQAALAETYKVNLVNNTGYDIKGLYIAPSSDEEFVKSEELLGGQAFKKGTSVTITFTGNAKVWDMLVSWSDGSGDEEWNKIKWVPGAKYALDYNKDTDVTTLRKL